MKTYRISSNLSTRTVDIKARSPEGAVDTLLEIVGKQSHVIDREAGDRCVLLHMNTGEEFYVSGD
jgi:hypothetical protein